MEKPVYRALILLMLLFCMVFPLNAEQLMFETSTGTLTDLSLGDYDGNNPSSYTNSTQYYDLPGFVGRLVYQGDGNTLYFDRGSLIAQKTTNNRFYYTRVNTNGSADTSRWREFFLVVRVKGLYHNGNQHDFIGHNYVVEHPGDSIPVIGAGPQTVAAGEAGYNASGASGINNTTNSYPYKYQHAYLWLDVIVIRTGYVSSKMNNGSYETQLVISGNGVASFLNLSGYRNYENGDTPESYYFGVERAAPEYIPFSDLISKTSYTDSYLVGYLSFHSMSETGTVRFASNSTGTAANFRFSATIDAIQRSFPYYVVFDATLPNGNPTRITSAYTGFNTGSSYVPTVIGGDENWEQVLKGEIRIYVDSGLQVYSYPANTGTGSAYTSTIYCLLTIN
ncbi:MAG: hypothetical protein AB9828_01145 [Sphaerochaetaceae bacterium]